MQLSPLSFLTLPSSFSLGFAMSSFAESLMSASILSLMPGLVCIGVT